MKQQDCAEEMVALRQKVAELEAENRNLRKQMGRTQNILNTEADLRQAVMVLTGSMAHDLRTPIATIHMQGTLLKNILTQFFGAGKNENAVSATGWAQLERLPDSIIRATQQMQAFIRTTLKTLGGASQDQLSREELVVCSAWHAIQNVLLDYPLTEAEKALIKWDQNDFQFLGNELFFIRVINNLLKNSLRQIKKNQHGEIFISTEETETAHILRFKDTAGGAPPAVVANLFQGYQTTEEDGTGLGLAFCKMTMESFGGQISCHSIFGDYIEFVLSFPKVSLPPIQPSASM